MIYNSEILQRHSKKINQATQETLNLEDYFNNIDINNIASLSVDEISTIFSDIEDYDNIVSTSQLNIDYSSFKNHVFFDSAINKINYTIKKIIDFPHDKSRHDYNKYINGLEGYCDYILKNKFPKNKGHIKFLGNEKVMVKNKSNTFDQIGYLKPLDKFSINFWLKYNKQSLLENNNQVICRFFNNNTVVGFILYLSIENNNIYLNSFVSTDGRSYLQTKCHLPSEDFQNVCVNVYSKNSIVNTSMFINGNKQKTINSDTSGSYIEFNDSLESTNTNFIIGNSENLGLNINSQEINFSNLSGEIDEFRYYHNVNTSRQIKDYMIESVFSTPYLKLYLKFNEPGGNYTNSFVCIDSSGNKSNGEFKNNNNENILDTTNYKISSDILKLEDINFCPVLISHYPLIQELHQELMTEAREYDTSNSNLIFKLFPKHYFLESADQENLPIFSNDETLIYETDGIAARQPANNMFVNIVLIWAKFFDQLKMHVDSISSLVDIDYDTLNNEKIIGTRIPLLCKLYGFDFSEVFLSISNRKKNNQALTYEDVISAQSIRQVQNKIWYKLLINSQNILKSRGTIKAINEIKNVVGISTLNNIEFNEKSTFNNLSMPENIFYEKREPILYSTFVTKNLLINESIFSTNDSGFALNKPIIEVLNLKNASFSSANDFKATSVSDGLGNSFSIELFFNLSDLNIINKQINNISGNISGKDAEQSLLRIDYWSSPVLSIYAVKSVSDSNHYDIYAEYKTLQSSHQKNVTLLIKNINLVQDIIYLCFKQKLEGNNIYHDLVISKTENKNINDITHIASQSQTLTNQQVQNLTSNRNNLNLRIGEYFYDDTTTELFAIEETKFYGNVYAIKTWSKSLDNTEIDNHINNIFNVSENSLSTSYLVNNFYLTQNNESNLSQTLFDKIRYEITNNSNNISNRNQNLNYCYLSISDMNFDILSLQTYKEIFTKNKNFKLDTSYKSNRVNILSFENEETRSKLNNKNIFPIHESPSDFYYENQNHVSLDFSVCKVLNDDISLIISNLDDFSKNIVAYNLHEYDYYRLNEYRKLFFTRYSDKEYIKYEALGNIFKYLDNIMQSMIKELMPSKSNFLGFNLVYESHVLERHKYEYKNSGSRLPINQNTVRSPTYNNNRGMSSRGILEV